MNNGGEVFTEINHSILDLQAAGTQNFQRPLKRLAQLLHSEDLEPANRDLSSKADLDAFLTESRSTRGSMVGSETLAWPDDANLQLGIFLKLMDLFGNDPDKAVDFGHEFFYSGNKIIAGVHAMTRDMIIPFTRDFKRYVLSRGKPAERLVISGSNKVFIVHGHDDAALQGLARFLGFGPIKGFGFTVD